LVVIEFEGTLNISERAIFERTIKKNNDLKERGLKVKRTLIDLKIYPGKKPLLRIEKTS